jgi:septal ring factor EnvC (AmiA/AmiB activator)
MSNTPQGLHAIKPEEVLRAGGVAREGTVMTRDDEAKSAWSDPRFLFQILAFVVVQIIGIASGYQILSARVTGIEASAQSMNNTAQELKGNVAAIQTAVATTTTKSAKLESDLEARGREIADLKQQISVNEARIIVLERSVARLEAKAGAK